MSSIYRYRPNIGRSSLDLMNQAGESASTDLCEIDGWRYVSVTDDAVPDVDIVIEPVVLTDELRAAIKQASPHCRLIKRRAWELLRDQFDDEDQRALDRKIAAAGSGMYQPTDADKAVFAAYQHANQSAMDWAASKYEELGL